MSRSHYRLLFTLFLIGSATLLSANHSFAELSDHGDEPLQCRALFDYQFSYKPAVEFDSSFDIAEDSRKPIQIPADGEIVAWLEKYRANANEEAMAEVEKLRSTLATLESKYPRGFNTWTVQRREARRATVTSLIRLGQERRALHLIREFISKFRSDYSNYLRLEARSKALAIETLGSSGRSYLYNSFALWRNERDRSNQLRSLAARMWDYTGIIEALMSEAGMMPPPSLLASPYERTLLSDAVNNMAIELQSAIPGLDNPSTSDMENPGPLTAKRVLVSLELWDPQTGNFNSPTLQEVDSLYRHDPIVRAGKVANEVKFERSEARTEIILGLINDPNIRKLLLSFLNRLSVGTLNRALAPVILQADLQANARLNAGRVSEFFNLSRRIPEGKAGNEKLAEVLTQIISAAPGVLTAIALREESIGPLNRVKSSDLAKNTVWGPNGENLALFIAREESKRADLGISTAVFNGETGRSYFTATSLLLGITGIVIHNNGDEAMQAIHATWESLKLHGPAIWEEVSKLIGLGF